MSDSHEKLSKLDNDKLFDVVKNYRQYGYDDSLRETAIYILIKRGISKEQIQFSGSFENKTYDFANEIYASFLKNSKNAFIMYWVVLISKMVINLLPNESVGLAWTLFFVILLSFILYFIFLILSFINQNKFYKAIGQEQETEGALLYLFLGLPLYFIMYFYFRNQMKEKINEIR